MDESHFARKYSPFIIDMNGNDTFLDINNAHLRVNSGNVQASTFVLDQINIVTSANTASTVNFNNVTKAFNAASNIEVGTANLFVDTTTSNVGIGTDAPAYTLDVHGTANVGNLYTTSNVGINTNSPQQTLHINGGTLIGGHVLPTQHEQFDIGSAEAKIRHMFLSDNSLWIGDEAKLSFTGNQLKFRRRKKNAVPRGLVAIGAAQDPELNESTLQTNALAHANKPSVGDMKLEHWLAYAKTLDATKQLSDVFTNQDADYDATSASEAFKEIGNEIYSTHKLRLGSSVAPTATLDITGTAKVSGDVTVDTNTFHIDTTNNRVGIGVTSPQTNFHVESSGSTGIDVYGGDTSHPSIFIGEHMTNYSRKWGGKFTYYGDSNIRWLNVSVVDDNVETPALTVRRNAHIGINEESPETTLHITNETATTGTGDAFISNLTGNTNNRKPTECLRLQGPGPHSGGATGNGALLRFTNYHSSGNTPNSGEYNLAGIAGYDHDNAWGGGLAFYTSPGAGSGGDDLTLRMSLDSSGGVHIPGPTTGANHGPASMLYLLDTCFYKEWSYTNYVAPVAVVTFNTSTEIPAGAKSILAEVFLARDSITGGDHQVHVIGKNHTASQQNWQSGPGQPSLTFSSGVGTRQVVEIIMPGESDQHTHYFGNWHSSVIIPLEDNKIYYSNHGNSSSTGWIYIRVRGYYI